MYKRSLPKKRKYKTLSSIPKESNEYKIFKTYIDLEEQMFNIFSSQKTENQLEELIKPFLLKFEKVKDQKHFQQYFIDLLVYYILIRPKQAEITCNLLSILLSNNRMEHTFIMKAIQNNSFYENNSFIKDILYSQGIIDELIYGDEYYEEENYEEENYEGRKSTVFSTYAKGSLEYILKENDVDSLKEYIVQNNVNSESTEINTFQYKNSQFSLIYHSVVLTMSLISIDLLDFCSYYSSFECFQFLQTNGFPYGDLINIFSVAGGNLSIIHELEQNGVSYDFCFEISVQYHQLNVTEWLLANYDCEIISLTEPIEYYEYKTLFYMLLIDIDFDVDINKGNYKTPLITLCQQKEINPELIKYFVEQGADVNNGSDYSKPLFALCQHEEINVELIKYFVDHGADVNKECLYQGSMVTPLLVLCRKKEINVELIKYFVDHGADVNKGKYDTPLFELCQKKDINIWLIKYFVEHGADINNECIFQGISVTPLLLLCQKKDNNVELVKYFIEHGADINKECKNIKENTTITPLLSLCQQREINSDLVKYLIENGADVNKGNICTTPLLSLCKQRKVNFELIKYLVEHGANVNVECKENFGRTTITPLIALNQHNEINQEIIQYIIEHGAHSN